MGDLAQRRDTLAQAAEKRVDNENPECPMIRRFRRDFWLPIIQTGSVPTGKIFSGIARARAYRL